MRDFGRLTAAICIAIAAGVIILNLLGAPRFTATGLLPVTSQVTDVLALQQTRVVAGELLHGELIVNNESSSPFLVSGACGFPVQVELKSDSYTPNPTFPDCSSPTLRINPGTHRFPIEIQTTYLDCWVTTSARDEPRCGGRESHNLVAPPLPAGSYKAVVFGDHVAFPAAPPVPVRLITGAK